MGSFHTRLPVRKERANLCLPSNPARVLGVVHTREQPSFDLILALMTAELGSLLRAMVAILAKSMAMSSLTLRICWEPLLAVRPRLGAARGRNLTNPLAHAPPTPSYHMKPRRIDPTRSSCLMHRSRSSSRNVRINASATARNALKREDIAPHAAIERGPWQCDQRHRQRRQSCDCHLSERAKAHCGH